MLRNSLFAAGAVGAVLCLPVFAAADDEIDIVGRYNYASQLQGGGTETGTTEIRKQGETYQISWLRADKVAYTGVGIRTGNILSICYSYPGAGERGLCVYKIT